MPDKTETDFLEVHIFFVILSFLTFILCLVPLIVYRSKISELGFFAILFSFSVFIHTLYQHIKMSKITKKG